MVLDTIQLAAILKELRKQLKESKPNQFILKKVESRIGLSISQLSMIENGDRCPSFDSLNRICVDYGVPVIVVISLATVIEGKKKADPLRAMKKIALEQLEELNFTISEVLNE